MCIETEMIQLEGLPEVFLPHQVLQESNFDVLSSPIGITGAVFT
jgi:hypothetical protein